MSTIRRRFRVEGVLTDPTSMALSDAAATYGVKRDDTGAVVVAAGTPMNRLSVGDYSYTFTDPAYGLTYTYSIEVGYGGELHHFGGDKRGPSAPTTAAMSTLRLSYWDLIERVSDYMGMGMSPAGDDLARVRARISDGYRRYLNPPVLPKEQAPHLWSWLAPATTLTLVSGTGDYNLPADFAQLIGSFNYALGESQVRYIEVTSVDRVMRARADVNQSGIPFMVAIRPKTSSTITGHVFEALFYPTPSSAMTLNYRYQVEQNKLDTAIVAGSGEVVADGSGSYNMLLDTGTDFSGVSAGDIAIISNADGPKEGIYRVASTTNIDEGASPSPSPSPWADTITVVGDFTAGGTCSYEILPATIYPLGTMDCMEALTESCLAVAEMQHDDALDIHSGMFMQLIEAAIQRDRMRGPRTLGYNADRSDDVEGSRSRQDRTISYNGVPVG